MSRPTDYLSLQPSRVGVLQVTEVRPVKDLFGREGILLRLGELYLVIVHKPDGGADLMNVDANGNVRHEWNFNPTIMDALVTWAAGPRVEHGGGAEPALEYCGPCIRGDHSACKGEDRCECDHRAASALQKSGPMPQ